MFFRLLLLFCLGICFASAGSRKELQPEVKCSKDTVKIGEPFEISLFLDYPCGWQILFPDSSFSFGNAMLTGRRFFPTRSSTELSRDCVVYSLSCFAPDSVQTFRMPILLLGKSDTSYFYGPEVKVAIRQVLPPGKEKNPFFEEDVNPLAVALRLNYPYLLSGIAALLALVLLVNFFFDKPIQKFFYLWVEQRRHHRFLRAFSRMEQILETDQTIPQMEAIIVLWKRYLQRVESKPYLTYTSLEINRLLADQNLKTALQAIDRWIYGGMPIDNLSLCLRNLRDKSVELYEKKRNNIRSGKS
jgi:hypothetical protein